MTLQAERLRATNEWLIRKAKEALGDPVYIDDDDTIWYDWVYLNEQGNLVGLDEEELIEFGRRLVSAPNADPPSGTLVRKRR